MKTLILITLLIACSNAYPQEEKYIIKFCPLSLVDEVSNPSIQFGLEIRLSSRLSLYNEFGVKYRKGYYESYDTTFIRSYGFKTKTELRYYFPRILGLENTTNTLSGFYVGANIYYIRDCHNDELGYFNKLDSSTLILDDLAVKKNDFGLNIIFGLQKTYSKHFQVDFYAGIGARFRSITNIHREYDSRNSFLEESADITLQGIRDLSNFSDRFHILPNLTLGIRLCYKL